MTKIGFAGDWHGNLLHAEIALEKLAACGVKHVFQLGDFGLFGSQLRFSGDKYRQKLQHFRNVFTEIIDRADQDLTSFPLPVKGGLKRRKLVRVVDD